MSPLVLTYWHWWMAAVALLATEAFFPGAIFLWLGIASAAVGVLCFVLPAIPWEWQMTLFAVLSLASILLWRHYVRAPSSGDAGPLLNQRGQQYIGRNFTLSEGIVNGVGKLRVDDTIWRALGPDCPAGTVVVVTGVEGVSLRVRASTSD